jgi:hypothetical protein
MKWFVLQLLLLLCVVDMPVLGKWKERVYSDAEIPDYVLSELKLKAFLKNPTDSECRTFCKAHMECKLDHYCCHASCGNVCIHMDVKESESRNVMFSVELITIRDRGYLGRLGRTLHDFLCDHLLWVGWGHVARAVSFLPAHSSWGYHSSSLKSFPNKLSQ